MQHQVVFKNKTGKTKNYVDKGIVLLMKQGQEAAFSSCYQQLSPLIYSIIFRICGNAAIAEEIMQDTFIQGFNNLAQLKDDNSFAAWLKRIAFNKAISAMRRHKDVESFEEETMMTHDMPSIDQHIIHNNQLAFLMNQLSPDSRMIVWLFVVEGYSHQEIADMVGKTVSYSKSLVSRSLAKLRDINKENENALQ